MTKTMAFQNWTSMTDMPKRNLRFALLFAWTCGGLIWSLVLLVAIGFWPAKIVRTVYVDTSKAAYSPAKAAPIKKMEHTKGYLRDSRARP